MVHIIKAFGEDIKNLKKVFGQKKSFWRGCQRFFFGGGGRGGQSLCFLSTIPHSQILIDTWLRFTNSLAPLQYMMNVEIFYDQIACHHIKLSWKPYTY